MGRSNTLPSSRIAMSRVIVPVTFSTANTNGGMATAPANNDTGLFGATKTIT